MTKKSDSAIPPGTNAPNSDSDATKEQKEPLNDYSAFLQEFQEESPRAAAILAGALLDAQLGNLLEKYFVDGLNRVGEFLEDNGPLSTFSSKIKVAYCLGLIGEAVYHDLNAIRKIRNEFAHKLHGYTVDEPQIVSWCKSLKLAKMITDASSHIPNTHQSMFLIGVDQLSRHIGLKTLEIEGLPRRTVPSDPPKPAQTYKVRTSKSIPTE